MSTFDNEPSLRSLDDDMLAQLMCDMSLSDMSRFAQTEKRIYSIFNDPLFFNRCIKPKIKDKKTKKKVLLGMHTIDFYGQNRSQEVSPQDNLSKYTMRLVGKSLYGITYDIECQYRLKKSQSLSDTTRRGPTTVQRGHEITAIIEIVPEIRSDLRRIIDTVEGIIGFAERRFRRYLSHHVVRKLNEVVTETYAMEIDIEQVGTIEVSPMRRRDLMLNDAFTKLSNLFGLTRGGDGKSNSVTGSDGSVEVEGMGKDFTADHIRELIPTIEQMIASSDDKRHKRICTHFVEAAQDLLAKPKDSVSLASLTHVYSQLLDCIATLQ
jgi:hypothetical protein